MSSVSPRGHQGGGLPPLRDDACQVWWASPRQRRAWHDDLLDGAERARRDRLRRAEDRDRFVVAVALTRIVVASHLGVAARRVQIDRTCPQCGEPHGKPRLTCNPALLAFSLSHSGDRVVVAVVPRAAPVGVDVEALVAPADPVGLSRLVLSPAERAAFDLVDPRDRGDALLRFWTRKEAVVKATGDGLNEPLTNLTVTAPEQDPRLLHWTARPECVPQITLYDLHPGQDFLASLAVFGGPVAVSEIDAEHVLTSGDRSSTFEA